MCEIQITFNNTTFRINLTYAIRHILYRWVLSKSLVCPSLKHCLNLLNKNIKILLKPVDWCDVLKLKALNYLLISFSLIFS